MTKQMKFGYPRRNLKGEFVTFRLGKKAAKDYQVGDTVKLVDSKTGKLLIESEVVAVDGGSLESMAAMYGHDAHNWKDYPEQERPELLKASMKRRYFPGRCTEESHTTVIRLRQKS